MPNLSKKAYARRKLILRWRRFLGLCVMCGAEACGNSLCDRCRARSTTKQRERRESFKINNLCRGCGKVEVKAGQYYCELCSAMMRARRKKRICNTDGCYNEALFKNQYCQECYDKKEAEKQSCRLHFLKCKNCDKPFISSNKGKKYCSETCYRDYYLRSPIKRNCVVCGKEYDFIFDDGFNVVCSKECQKELNRESHRNSKHIRRIRKATAFVEHVSTVKLFKRDRKRCQLCGKKLNLKRPVPHPLAATIDHIIPLSKGGEHSYRNTQLACFKCNCAKSNNQAAGGEQLRMFGGLW